MAKLNRALGLTECVFFGVGSILGAGIYTLIGKISGMGGYMSWISFLIASVAALFTALSYAELSAAFPKAGGEYVYTTRAFGKKTGIVSGIVIALNGIITGATVSIGFAGYLGELIGIHLMLAALGIIVLIFLVNITGIRQSSVINIIFTIIEAGGLIFVIAVSFSSFGSVNYFEMPDEGISAVIGAAALAFFSYVGFEEIVKLAEETHEPQKNIPRALFIASVIVIVMYTLVSISAVSVLTPEELQNAKGPLAEVAAHSVGQNGIAIISVIALFATSNTILSNMIGSSRVLWNMSQETKLLRPFSFISAKRKTPVTSLLAVLLVMAAFALIGEIETIARIATIFIFIAFILVNLSVVVLRVKEKNLRRPYRVPFNIKNIPLPSVLGILFTTLLLGYTIHALSNLNNH
jgi:basic amino acid/polyamine antiporter, APA family